MEEVSMYVPYRIIAHVKYKVKRFTKRASNKVEEINMPIGWTISRNKDVTVKDIRKVYDTNNLISQLTYETFPPIREEGLITLIDWEVVLNDVSGLSYGKLQNCLTVEQFVIYSKQFE
jgi:hypothetical protein